MLFQAGLIAAVLARGVAAAPGCNENNLLRAFIRTSAAAAAFCSTFTQGPGRPLPTFVPTTYEIAKYSSACSCIATGAPASTTTTSPTSSPTTTSSSTPSTTATGCGTATVTVTETASGVCSASTVTVTDTASGVHSTTTVTRTDVSISVPEDVTVTVSQTISASTLTVTETAPGSVSASTLTVTETASGSVSASTLTITETEPGSVTATTVTVTSTTSSRPSESACPVAGQSVCPGPCKNLQGDPANCGTCGNVCPTPPNTVSSCQDGSCTWTCLPGFADCNGIATDGCEAHLAVDPIHCGACQRPCPQLVPNGIGQCQAGTCRTTCNQGFLDCNNNAADGCEIDGRNNDLNCGACARRCLPQGPNSLNTCVNNNCLFSCRAPFMNCDNDPLNGCEVDGSNNPNHCGLCFNACPQRPNAVRQCVNFNCPTTLQCLPDYADCDANPVNGCEVNIQNDNNHCGRCGNPVSSAPCRVRSAGNVPSRD